MASRTLGGSGRPFESYDVIAVGGGQAGLAVGYFRDARFIAERMEDFRATRRPSVRREAVHVR